MARGDFPARAARHEIEAALAGAATKVSAEWPPKRSVPPLLLWRHTVDAAAQLTLKALTLDETFLPGTRSWTELAFGDADGAVAGAGDLPWDPTAPLKPPFFVQSVFGILRGIGPHPEDVMHMKRTADRLFGEQYSWSVLGAGANQMRIAAQAAAMGGNVRVGLEGSLWIGRSGPVRQDQCRAGEEGAGPPREAGLSVATPTEARELLQLKGADRVAF